MQKKPIVLLSTLILLACTVLGTSGDTPPAHKDSAEFARIKSLAGKWEAPPVKSEKMPDNKNLVVQYDVVSGGNAVIEELFPGTNHSMISLYYDNPDGKLAMTHYCVMGNRPQMVLKTASAQVIDLDYTPSPGIDASKDEFMHGVTLTLADANHLTHNWHLYKGGKEVDHSEFHFTRVM